ncbi:MAG TPA: hypothetical protein VGB85_25065, partial [Nannocystis sp.]
MTRATHRRLGAAKLGVAAILLLACNSGEPEPPQLQRLRLPSGALLTPDNNWLLVTNSNLDQREDASTLVAIDLRQLDKALVDTPLAPDAVPTLSRPCRRTVDDAIAPLECDAAQLIARKHAIRLPSGAGNIALDRPAGESGPLRLLIPSGIARRITWVDVVPDGLGGLDLDCGQLGEGDCDPVHVLEYLDNRPAEDRLPADPARIFIDRGGFRYAYLPHLLGSAITLIALDAEFGPKITDIETEFYRSDPINNNTFSGGFAVAQRACDPADPPAVTRDCTRPMLYTTHRFWPGVRTFTVRTGQDTIIPGGDQALVGVNPTQSKDRPFMADLEFEDPATGERLLVVHTTPPSLSLVDTRLDDDKDPINRQIATVSLCSNPSNPNILAIDRPPVGERLALVSCYSDDQIAVVGLGAFQVISTLDVDDGPNELVIDDARRRLYVVNTP